MLLTFPHISSMFVVANTKGDKKLNTFNTPVLPITTTNVQSYLFPSTMIKFVPKIKPHMQTNTHTHNT